MKNTQIVFTAPCVAEYLEVPVKEPGAGEVMVETEISTVSPGTEKANLIGDPNVAGSKASAVVFPRMLGYSTSGRVVAVGEGVSHVAPGDKVVAYWGYHTRYNVIPAAQVVKLPYAENTMTEAAIAFIASFPLAAVRKTRLEFGESAIVMGLGLLGQIAVKLLRISGAAPILAVDPVKERREEALRNGADYVLDPFAADFAERAKALTGGGAKVGIEVTGVGAGLNGILDCMAQFGRVALLGCTRSSDFTVDYYKKVHFPGISLIGAHTCARPTVESHPGYFTHNDDIDAVLKMCAMGRLDLASMVKEIHTPDECGAVYTRLANDKSFPILVQFDWTKA